MRKFIQGAVIKTKKKKKVYLVKLKVLLKNVKEVRRVNQKVFKIDIETKKLYTEVKSVCMIIKENNFFFISIVSREEKNFFQRDCNGGKIFFLLFFC